MDLIQSLILGIVEGVTEYLPVSSTGHLLFSQYLMGVRDAEAANAFAICIQGGAILAVLFLYWRRITEILMGFLGRNKNGLKLGVNLLVAFMPAAIIGLVFSDLIERYLFGIVPVIFAWLFGGIIILMYHKHPRMQPRTKGIPLSQLTWKQSLAIGCFQCMAMCPGVSRSLATIMGGVFIGLAVGSAIEFSFLLGMITLCAATLYTLVQHGTSLFTAYNPVVLSVGFISAFFTAIIAIKWMVGYLNKYGMSLFGYWRILIAVLATILILL